MFGMGLVLGLVSSVLDDLAQQYYDEGNEQDHPVAKTSTAQTTPSLPGVVQHVHIDSLPPSSFDSNERNLTAALCHKTLFGTVDLTSIAL